MMSMGYCSVMRRSGQRQSLRIVSRIGVSDNRVSSLRAVGRSRDYGRLCLNLYETSLYVATKVYQCLEICQLAARGRERKIGIALDCTAVKFLAGCVYVRSCGREYHNAITLSSPLIHAIGTFHVALVRPPPLLPSGRSITRPRILGIRQPRFLDPVSPSLSPINFFDPTATSPRTRVRTSATLVAFFRCRS
ncbi:hypothetical protein BU16DRAFT_118806 [Lophium mytilinum]|uniref:Uncharacterized protein n=1 Tax=Lophium mytilinum TaxID=390894 RepID=A0A6A6QG80_9PEZI|nr:hypothetical protein BU16DRAFT_118806 [Lophium mytilinum]